MDVVFAKATTTAALPNGAVVTVMEGTHWRAEDPIVQMHPDLFSDDPRYGMLFTQPLRPEDYPGAELPQRVEHATAIPGDRRNVRRG